MLIYVEMLPEKAPCLVSVVMGTVSNVTVSVTVTCHLLARNIPVLHSYTYVA